jgi:hypothetical protein
MSYPIFAIRQTFLLASLIYMDEGTNLLVLLIDGAKSVLSSVV